MHIYTQNDNRVNYNCQQTIGIFGGFWHLLNKLHIDKLPKVYNMVYTNGCNQRAY